MKKEAERKCRTPNLTKRSMLDGKAGTGQRNKGQATPKMIERPEENRAANDIPKAVERVVSAPHFQTRSTAVKFQMASKDLVLRNIREKETRMTTSSVSDGPSP